MIEDSKHYESRAFQYVRMAEAAQGAGDGERADLLILFAVENLQRAAAKARPPRSEALVGRADSLMDLIEEGTGAEAPSDGSAAGSKRKAAEGEDGDAGKPWRVISETGITFEDVVGLEEPKRLICDMVLRPLLDPEGAARWRRRVGGGILLYGPPGNGKTFFAKALAGELGAAFISVHAPHLMSKWVGDAEKNVDALFDEARRHELCVVFLDEVEGLISRRGGGSTVMDRVVPTFLEAMDGIAGRNDGLLLLGATNRPDAMDAAALRPGRFDRQVYVGLPEAEARVDILKKRVDGLPTDPSVNLDGIALQLEGYSAADLGSICEDAASRAFQREFDEGKPTSLTARDFELAIEVIKPSVSAQELKRYQKIKHGFDKGQ